MQLHELEIKRFGVWENVTFPLNERGVTVLYGPNEAGKSTLMRFIRGVLYGFPIRDERSVSGRAMVNQLEQAGSLKLSHHGQNYKLTRHSKPGTRGQLEINGRAVRDDDSLLKSMTGDIPEVMFENVFAIGLNELQQLATLNGEDVSRHLYGLSLGPEGKQIFQAHAGFAADEKQLIGPEAHEGRLRTLVDELSKIDRELARIGPSTDRYGNLQGDLRKLEDEIESRKSRQAHLQHELRGRQFMNRLWNPWKKERDLQRQMDRLPADDVDREILNRYDEVELELSEIDDRRKSLIAEARQLQASSDAIKTRPELEQHACAIQNLFEKSRSMQALERTLSTSAPGTGNYRRDLDHALARLKGSWDQRRLEQTDVSPNSMSRLMASADGYRQAGRQRKRLVRKYKKASTVLRRLQNDWKSNAQGLGNRSTNETRQALQKRLAELEELRGLRFRREHLRKTAQFMQQQQHGPEVIARDLPEFFWLILWFFVISGVVLFGAGGYAALHGYAGMVAGGPTAWIAGGCLSFLGLSVMGIAWVMKDYFESIDFRTVDRSDDRNAIEQELFKTEQAIERLAKRDVAGTNPAGFPTLAATISNPQSEAEQEERIRQQLASLGYGENSAAKIEKLRKRLSLMRQSLQDRQRQLGRNRREWTDSLRQMGLSETLKISQAFEQCNLIFEAKSLMQNQDLYQETERRQREELDTFYQQVDELARKLEDKHSHSRDRYHLLAEWERELQLQGERRRERSRLRQSAKEKRHEASKIVERIEKMRQQRTSLLMRLGVNNRGEIAVKLAAIDERVTLEQQLKAVREEISKLAASEPNLAITEDDLSSFEEARNLEAIETLRREIADLEAQQQKHFELLGTLKQELREIEDDRTLTSLRFDREQQIHSIRETAEKWCALRLADQVVTQLRQRIEKDRQPRMLQAASQHLHQLTCGKYNNIWTPLGDKILMVDDDQGNSLRVEHLSSGTREQVFLAVRMAMVREFAEKGTELPLVLDDVTVNFDQTRTEAAVRTLSEVAEQGQQILLFTCHLHLAHLFQNEGLEPIWLPAHRTETQLQS